jgi:uncharacterized hydrophobic protein (TIGR00271 family)
MPTIDDADLARMRERLLFSGPEANRKLSQFWVLLVLAAIIASAGVVGDSTATVIGAMIVAPLMTPILGTVLSVATLDWQNLGRSVLLVVLGAAAVIVIGWLSGQLVSLDVVEETNSQVAGRVHPRVVDLVAALATGTVGAFAVLRSDISDTLPGVAIAISLVPPLAVVGLTLEAGEGDQAAGALLLFMTNVTAILLSGLAMMALFKVFARSDLLSGRTEGRGRGVAIVIVALCVAAIAVPLAISGASLTASRVTDNEVRDVSEAWAEAAGWRIVGLEETLDDVVITASGPPPAPDPQALRQALDDEGLESLDVRLDLIPQDSVELPGSD